MKRLTDVRYWESHYWSPGRPERLRFLYRDVDYEFVRLLRRFGKEKGTGILELRAGGSRILLYFERKLQYSTVGSDFSFVGCRLLPWLTRVGNGLLSLFFRLLPFRPHCRLTSPTIFAVEFKPGRLKSDPTAPEVHETRNS